MPLNSVDALKARFRNAAKDGRITRAECEELLRAVKDGGGVTDSERRHLRDQVAVFRDRFENDASRRMDAFFEREMEPLLIDDVVVGNRGSRANLPDPAVLDKDRALLRYEWTEGALFKDGVSGNEVIQGSLGDCYFAAGLAAVATKEPSAITRAILENANGTFTVRFFDLPFLPMFGETLEVKVTVDGQLPTRSGGLRYGRNRDRSELWVAVLEKAFAQWKGSYGTIASGGSPAQIMSALTGRPCEVCKVSPEHDGKSFFEKLKKALSDGRCAATGTYGKERAALYAGTGIYANHAYSITDATVEGDRLFITLRNPWGEVEPRGNGADDGVFKLELSEFQRLFGEVALV